MSWLFVNDENGGTYAEEGAPDPQQMVSIDELQTKIDELQIKIDSIELMIAPIGANEDLSSLVNDVNGVLSNYLFELETEKLICVDLKTMLEAL